MADASLIISINTDPAQPLQLIIRQAKDAEKEVSSLGSSFGRVGTAIAGLAVLKGTFDFVIGATRQMEDLTTQFISFTGSAEGAQKQLARLAQFAAESPFELAEVANADRTLLAFGSTTSESIKQLRMLGEASAATGTNLTELATIFGQIQGEGKLTGERFNQLVERGINIGPALAQTLGVAEGSLRKLREAGKITGDDVGRAFEKMTTEGGLFFGATDRLSKTVSGRISTLKDNFTALAATIGNTVSPIFGGYVDVLSEAATALNNYITAQKQLANAGPEGKRIEELKTKLADLETIFNNLTVEPGSFVASIKGLFFNGQKGLDEERAKIGAKIKATNDELNALLEKGSKERLDASAKDQADEEKLLAKKKKSKVDDLAQQKAAEDQAIKDKAAKEELVKLQEKEKKITEIAFLEAAVRNQILIEQEGANNSIKIQILKEREADLTATRLNLEADRQEQLRQFDDAEILRTQNKLNSIEAAERDSLAKKQIERDKANKGKLDREVQAEEAYQKFLESAYQKQVDKGRTGLAALASLRNSSNKDAFNIGKRAAQAQILLDIPRAAFAAYTSLIGTPFIGPVIAPLAAAAAVVAGQQQISNLENQAFGFAEGGIVPGVGNLDTVPALLTPGELIVPKSNFEDLQKNLSNSVTADQIVLLQQGNEIAGKILEVLAFGTVADKLTQVIAGLDAVRTAVGSISVGGSSFNIPTTRAESPQTTNEPTPILRSIGKTRDREIIRRDELA